MHTCEKCMKIAKPLKKKVKGGRIPIKKKGESPKQLKA